MEKTKPSIDSAPSQKERSPSKTLPAVKGDEEGSAQGSERKAERWRREWLMEAKR